MYAHLKISIDTTKCALYAKTRSRPPQEWVLANFTNMVIQRKWPEPMQLPAFHQLYKLPIQAAKSHLS